MAGCVQGAHFYALADREGGVVGRCFGDFITVFAAYYWEFEVFELGNQYVRVCKGVFDVKGVYYCFSIPSGVVMVALWSLVLEVDVC